MFTKHPEFFPLRFAKSLWPFCGGRSCSVIRSRSTDMGISNFCIYGSSRRIAHAIHLTQAFNSTRYQPCFIFVASPCHPQEGSLSTCIGRCIHAPLSNPIRIFRVQNCIVVRTVRTHFDSLFPDKRGMHTSYYRTQRHHLVFHRKPNTLQWFLRKTRRVGKAFQDCIYNNHQLDPLLHEVHIPVL